MSRSRAHEARHQGRRHHHAVRRPLHAGSGPAEDGLPGPAHLGRAFHRLPQHRGAHRREDRSRGDSHRRREGLPSHAVRQHGRPVPGGGRPVREPVQAPAPQAVLRCRRLHRPEPPGPAGVRHGGGLHQGGEEPGRRALLRRPPAPHSGRDPRHHGLPRADHADLHGHVRLLRRQVRQAAQGHGQEEARHHAPAAGRLGRGRRGERLPARRSPSRSGPTPRSSRSTPSTSRIRPPTPSSSCARPT